MNYGIGYITGSGSQRVVSNMREDRLKDEHKNELNRKETKIKKLEKNIIEKDIEISRLEMKIKKLECELNVEEKSDESFNIEIDL